MASSAHRYLLDTDVLSHLIRNPAGPIRERIIQAGPETICTSVIVAGELRFGSRKRNSPRLTRQVNAVLAALDILPLGQQVDEAYGAVRQELEQAGTMIGPNDLWIAAHARALGLIVATGNSAEYSRVRRLKVENWLQ